MKGQRHRSELGITCLQKSSLCLIKTLDWAKINPIISIASKGEYSVPLFLLIGWRGSPNIPDEPQHKAKGKITLKLLKLMNIDYCIIRVEKDL